MSKHFPSRRRGLATAAALAASFLWPLAAHAQTAAWPDRPVKVIVPYAAGQGADTVMRQVAQELSKSLQQAFVIDNRAGAGGNIGTSAAAKAAPDGYNFMLGTNATHAANEFLYPNLGFDPAADFVPVAMIGMLPMVISTSAADLPANGIAELVARARAKPDSLNVGLPSTTAQVVFAQFVKAAQAPLFAVKYKASAQSMTDAIGGQIPLVIDTVTATRGHVASGRLKPLGITSLKSSDLLPGVKSVAEQGIAGFEVVAWNAVFAPRGTPPEVVQKMSEHIRRAVQQPELRQKLMDIGVEPLFMDAAQLDRFVREERPKWGGVIKAAGVRVD